MNQNCKRLRAKSGKCDLMELQNACHSVTDPDTHTHAHAQNSAKAIKNNIQNKSTTAAGQQKQCISVDRQGLIWIVIEHIST